MKTFRRIGSKSQEVATRIQQEIVDGRVLPGEKLASVRELAACFDVGRQVVISAFSILVETGVVVSRPRQGYYVNPMLMPEVIKERTLRVGLLIWKCRHHIPGISSTKILQRSLSAAAPEFNCEVFIAQDDENFVEEWFFNKRLDILIVSGLVNDDLMLRLQDAGIPALAFANQNLKDSFNHVDIAGEQNTFNSLCEAINKLQVNRVAMITDNFNILSVQHDIAGFKRALKTQKLTLCEPWICCGAPGTGFAMMDQLMNSQSEKPELIMVHVAHFPEVARYIFRYDLTGKRKPYLLLTSWNNDMFYPELVDLAEHTDNAAAYRLLKITVDLFLGRLRQPYRETILLEPPYCHEIPHDLFK